MHKEISSLGTYTPKTGRVDTDCFPSASTQLENSSMDFEDSDKAIWRCYDFCDFQEVPLLWRYCGRYTFEEFRVHTI